MLSEYPSPDGAYVLTLGSYEIRMSHWIDYPTLQVSESKEVLFDAPALWSADSIEWSADSNFVRMNLRVYPGSKPSLEVCLYPATRRGKALSKSVLPPAESDLLVEGSLADLVRFLEAYGK